MEAETPSTVDSPEEVWKLQTPAAESLAALTAIFEDLTRVVTCCEQILSISRWSSSSASETVVEALWTTGLVSYRRCFSADKSTTGLTEKDLEETTLQGDVADWHRTLMKLRTYYVDSRINAHDNFVVGVVPDENGDVSGIAVTSTPQPQPDETTTRQTGQLALELSRLVDQRIKAQQQVVYDWARSMTRDALSGLPVVYVSRPHKDESSSTGQSP